MNPDRGGIGLGYAFVKTTGYTAAKSIEIPWSNKELDIQFETFRDKLLPGSKETWKVKIKGQ